MRPADRRLGARQAAEHRIIARAHYDDEVAYITDRGANQVVMGEREIANSMLNILQLDTLSEEEKMGGCPI